MQSSDGTPTKGSGDRRLKPSALSPSVWCSERPRPNDRPTDEMPDELTALFAAVQAIYEMTVALRDGDEMTFKIAFKNRRGKLALLWQIYSRCFSSLIQDRQYGHR